MEHNPSSRIALVLSALVLVACFALVAYFEPALLNGIRLLGTAILDLLKEV